MIYKGYLIEKYNDMGTAYTCRRLAEEAVNAGMELRTVGIHDTVITPDGIYNAGEKLGPVDFVLNRYKWGALKDAVNALGRKTYNPGERFNIYINKYAQVKSLRSSAFTVPRYMLGTPLTDFTRIVDALGRPFVAKGLESSMGKQISLVDTREDMVSLQAAYGTEKELLFEEFIQTSFGRDMRTFSIRGEAIACMERSSQGDFRANVALGAKVAPLEITPYIRQACRDIYEQTGLDFVGLDLMYGTDKPVFCEINVMPGLEGIEKASGMNIARMILNTVKEDLEND